VLHLKKPFSGQKDTNFWALKNSGQKDTNFWTSENSGQKDTKEGI
jgi:hypothetical protein